jgi:CNT family concentrative nucleoside transporter
VRPNDGSIDLPFVSLAETAMLQGVSLLGYAVFLLLAWLMSSHKFRVPWRVVLLGTALQFVLAMLVLKTVPGKLLFSAIGDGFTMLLDFVDAGSSFVFGPQFKDFYFAFKVLPTIIFFSSLTSILYYLGVMQIVVKGMARLMQWTLGTSAAETLSASANIFVGQTEAPLLVRPYISSMTRSELHAVMVGGFATIAGGVLAAFVGMGIDAGHLVTASVISAPAALVISKLMMPETELPVTLGNAIKDPPKQGENLLDAAAIGATEGMKLALNVAAMLLVFLALIAMVDKGIAITGSLFSQEWSLKVGLGYAFAPVAWLMGIEWNDCLPAGQLLGLKMATTEFVAYQELSEWLKPDSAVTLQPRTTAIMTYALCGFSNFASIGIQIGGLGQMAPNRQPDLARLGFRAMIGGTLACCLTACVAGAIL